jgi:hypothetical protein
MTPTVDQFLTKLQANPAEAREFDSYAPSGVSRRAHAELILARVNSSCANIASSKRLADQRAINAKLRQDVALAKNRLALLKAQASKAPPAPIKPQRELTGISRAAAAFAGTSTRRASTPPSGLTGHARTAAAFARK